MFVDASALVAMLVEEPEAGEFRRRVATARRALTSPVAVFEAALAIARVKRSELAAAQDLLQRFLEAAGLTVVAIGPGELEVALGAHARFGKGRHPARLNMGDCFAYACARTHGVPLLYKGGDFALTDITAA